MIREPEAEAMRGQAYMDDDMLDFSGYWDDEDAVDRITKSYP